MAEAKGEIKRTPKVPGIVKCMYCDGTGKHQGMKHVLFAAEKEK